MTSDYHSSFLDVMQKLVPIFFPYLLGISLKFFGILSSKGGERILTFVFYVSIPMLLLVAVPKLTLTYDLLYLPLIAVIIVGTIFIVARLTLPHVTQDRKIQGVVITACMLMNTGFMLPFMSAFYGQSGVVHAMVFDLGNASLAYSFVYLNAFKYSDSEVPITPVLGRLCKNIPLWAMAIGLFMNGLAIQVPQSLEGSMSAIGNLSFPLILLSLGLYFNPHFEHRRIIIYACFLRSAIGILLGLLCTWICGMQGSLRTITLLCSAAPIGYNTLIFSSIAQLNVAFAASLVSYSIVLGLLYVPLLIYILF